MPARQYNLDYYEYSDSDYAGDAESHKSTFGYVFFMAGGLISWKLAKQHTAMLSSSKAEYCKAALELLR